MSWRSMFIEDDASWPGLGFNPAKGDTEALGFLASDVKAVGEELDELHELIKKAGEQGSWWEGEAAERFSKKLGELPKYLKQGTDSMQECAKALRGWQSKLETFQQRAEKLESDAVEARKRADEKNAHHRALYDKYEGSFGVSMDAEKADSINAQLENARREAMAANDRLDELIRQGESIHANWKDRAGDAERAILEASENHPPDLGFWDRMADSLKGAWDGFKDWLVDNADLLSNISAGLGAAALALQFIPVVGNVAGGVLAVAAGVCAAGAMAGHWMGNARGNGTPGWKVGLDAFGVLPGIGAAGKLIKPATTGGGRFVQFAKEAGLRTRDSLSQRHLITGPTQKILGRFGKEMSQGATETFNGVSQIAIKSGSAAYGVYDRMTDGGESANAGKSPDGNKFHGALAS